MSRHYWPEIAMSSAAVVVFSVTAQRQWGLALATSLTAVVMLSTAIRWNLGDGDASRWWRWGLLTLCNALIAMLTGYWVMTDGLIFTRDFGESFSVFLAAHNASDFVTFLLQDMSTDRDRVGHPFLYTHQPSFVARLGAMLVQAFRLGIPANMALNFLVATLLLWTAANIFGKYLPWPVVLGGVLFVVSNYAVFHENIVDLTRAPGYFALFGGAAIVVRDPWLRTCWSKIGLATAIAAAAATDFVVCLFVGYVLAGMHLWLSKEIRWRLLLACFLLPCVVFYAVYFGTVAAAVGFDFFFLDMLFSYFGRAGQTLPAKLKSLGWIPNLPDTWPMIHRLYQETGVVLWRRPDAAFRPENLFLSVAWSWSEQASVVVAVAMGVMLAIAIASMIAESRRWWLVSAGGFAVVGLCAAFDLPLVVLVLIPAAFMFILADAVIPGRVMKWLGRDVSPDDHGRRWRHDVDAARKTQNALAFTAIAAMGVVLIAGVFPEYGIRFIILERRGIPAPLLEMLSFGLLVYVGWVMMRWGTASSGFPLFRWLAAASGATLVAGAVALVVTTNVELFWASPPRAPSYAGVLSGPEYRHEPFVTTSFYGQVWYFTRGWAYMVPSPPQKPFVDYWDIRHVRDWKNLEKYGRPHYFLCDNTQLKGYGPSFIPSAACTTRGNCSCVDVADYMREAGYAPVVVRQDFAIIDVRNTQGSLHRSSGAGAGQAHHRDEEH